jgi:hypothetical protein
MCLINSFPRTPFSLNFYSMFYYFEPDNDFAIRCILLHIGHLLTVFLILILIYLLDFCESLSPEIRENVLMTNILPCVKVNNMHYHVTLHKVDPTSLQYDVASQNPTRPVFAYIIIYLAQSNMFHTGMLTFGCKMIVAKVCKFKVVIH